MTNQTIVLRPKAIGCDFDFTVSYFVGGIDTITKPFTKRGISHEIAMQAEQAAEERGFCLSVYLEEIEKFTGWPFAREVIEPEFRRWMAKTIRTYEDARHAFEFWRTQRLDVVFVTLGNKEYQLDKIAMSQLPHRYAFVVDRDEAKWVHINQLLQAHGAPVVYIDDKPSVLDHIRDQDKAGEVITVRAKRAESPYYKEPARHTHHEVSDLTRLVFEE